MIMAKSTKTTTAKAKASVNVKRAEQAKAKAEASARADDRKAAATAKAKAGEVQTLKALAPMAKEINVWLEQAAKATARAFDLRLSAACKIAEAKDKCTTDKVNFKTWAEANIHYHYDTVRKLARIGASDDPAAALEDLRERTKTSVAKTRGNASKPASAASVEGAVRHKQETPEGQALALLDRLTDDTRVKLAETALQGSGLAVVPQASAGPKVLDLDNAKRAFDGLRPSDRMRLVEYAAKAVGASVTFATVPQADTASDDLLDVPKHLQAAKVIKGKGKGKGKRA
jgi:hypothetical protein